MPDEIVLSSRLSPSAGNCAEYAVIVAREALAAFRLMLLRRRNAPAPDGEIALASMMARLDAWQ